MKVGADGHDMEAAAAPPHIDECPQHNPTLDSDNNPLMPSKKRIVRAPRRDITGASATRDFDLNIEKVLDSWEVHHAIREIIANALDEGTLSGTKTPEIVQTSPTRWIVRDFGRGLHYQHLTQKENQEKRKREREVIGRFGVGLKDSLAVLDRRSIKVQIRSAHGDIGLVHIAKAGFPDVRTLHARVGPPTTTKMLGTEVELSPVAARDMEKAKSCFLRYNDESVLEETSVGQILKKADNTPGRIYINGLVVAEEPQFAFSYNVQTLTKAMRKALNRERTNVGRTAYTDRIKGMLIAAKSEQVAEILVADLERSATGTGHDEILWTDVAVRACQVLSARGHVVFVTVDDLQNRKEVVDQASRDGKRVVTVTSVIAEHLRGSRDILGKPVQSLTQYQIEYAASVEYRFVAESNLEPSELAILKCASAIAKAGGGKPRDVKSILVSETMRPSAQEGFHPAGVWEPSTGRVIIHRPVLRSLKGFAGTLLHEFTHARSGHPDVSRDFEAALTDVIGTLAAGAIKRSVD